MGRGTGWQKGKPLNKVIASPSKGQWLVTGQQEATHAKNEDCEVGGTRSAPGPGPHPGGMHEGRQTVCAESGPQAGAPQAPDTSYRSTRGLGDCFLGAPHRSLQGTSSL